MWVEVISNKYLVGAIDSYNPSTIKLLGAILLSLRSSVHLSLVHPSVHPSILHPMSTLNAYNSGWIHFIFTHLTKHPQKVCHNFEFVLFWFGIWCESIMGNHGVAGVSQNAGILVVLMFLFHVVQVSNPNSLIVFNYIYKYDAFAELQMPLYH